MRDAFGGTFMVQILLIFIIIYVGFIAIAINYGRAFRIKNYVIDYLEENEISSLSNLSAIEKTELENGIKNIAISNGYMNSDSGICNRITETDERKCINGIVIELKESVTKYGVTHVYYSVNTYIGYNLGFLNSLLSLGRTGNETSITGYFKISGETKVIVTS